jgi:hypothetical protein
MAGDLNDAPRLDLDERQRARLADLADYLIPGGHGLPSASKAQVHDVWIDRAAAVRGDLESAVLDVLAYGGSPAQALERVRTDGEDLFDLFAIAVSGAYLLNPRVRKGLGYPGDAPKPKPAPPDEGEFYLFDNILRPVIERGPIYRSIPAGDTRDGEKEVNGAA